MISSATACGSRGKKASVTGTGQGHKVNIVSGESASVYVKCSEAVCL